MGVGGAVAGRRGWRVRESTLLTTQASGTDPALHLCPSRSLRSQPLWKKVLSATALGLPLLLGVRYFTAEPQEKRRMRLMVDGVGRFGR